MSKYFNSSKGRAKLSSSGRQATLAAVKYEKLELIKTIVHMHRSVVGWG